MLESQAARCTPLSRTSQCIVSSPVCADGHVYAVREHRRMPHGTGEPCSHTKVETTVSPTLCRSERDCGHLCWVAQAHLRGLCAAIASPAPPPPGAQTKPLSTQQGRRVVCAWCRVGSGDGETLRKHLFNSMAPPDLGFPGVWVFSGYCVEWVREEWGLDQVGLGRKGRSCRSERD
jgi:hypothetical protein